MLFRSHLWAKAGVFEVQDVLTRSIDRARDAVRAISAGRAVAALDEMRAADVWLVATPDDAIAASCARLARSDKLSAGNIVFHVSGATSSDELGSARDRGAHVASVHPIKAFMDSGTAAQSFAGTYCGMEGDARALHVLKPAFEQIGARLFEIAAEMKRIYHAGGVFACNYLSALVEAAVLCHEKAGVPRAVSLKAKIGRAHV